MLALLYDCCYIWTVLSIVLSLYCLSCYDLFAVAVVAVVAVVVAAAAAAVLVFVHSMIRHDRP